MSKIKLYVILSILVFNLFEESCARGQGRARGSDRRRTGNRPCVGGGPSGPRGPSGSIDCKYFLCSFSLMNALVYVGHSLGKNTYIQM